MSFTIITKSVWSNPGNHGKRFRKTLQAVEWQFHKRTLRSPRLLLLPNGILFKAYSDCVLSSALVYADWPEYHELMFIRKQLCARDIVIDVGAYAGHISLLLADIVGHKNIFAFEPTPQTFQRLKENWQLNGWPLDNLYQVAVGAGAGKVFLKNDSHSTTMNSVTNIASDDKSIEVMQVRLDNHRSLWSQAPIGFLKIDVEGYELEVLKGSKEILEQARPRLIMFESLGGSLDRRISMYLKRHNYTVFQLDAYGQPDFSNDFAQNLFAIPREGMAGLK